MDAYQMASELEAYAKRGGFVAPQAYYIVGEINLLDEAGNSVYSDEAHLWCKDCGESLLATAHALMPAEEREEHFLCPTDAADEDTCPHCMKCGETLDGSVSAYAVSEEVAHYTDYPITDDDTINRRQAVEIAMILSAAPDDDEVLAIGRAALASIARAAA